MAHPEQAKKVSANTLQITSSNTCWFSKWFRYYILQEICKKVCGLLFLAHPVLTATAYVNGDRRNWTPHRIETPWTDRQKFCEVYQVRESTPCAKFHENPLMGGGGFSRNAWTNFFWIIYTRWCIKKTMYQLNGTVCDCYLLLWHLIYAQPDTFSRFMLRAPLGMLCPIHTADATTVELRRVGGVNAPVGSRGQVYNFLCCWAIEVGDKSSHNDVIVKKVIGRPIDQNSRSQTAMESVWSVSKLSIESVGSRRELVANCVHTADTTQLDSWVVSAVCIGH